MKINNVYKKIRSSLYSKRGDNIVHFLAHGAFHIFAAIILVIVCILLYEHTTKKAGTTFKNIELNFSDSHWNALERFYFEAGCGGLMKEKLGYSSMLYVQAKYKDPPLPIDTIYNNSGDYYYLINDKYRPYNKLWPIDFPFPFCTKLERKTSLTIKTPNSFISPFRHEAKDVNYNTTLNRVTYYDSISPKNNFIKIDTYYKMYHTSSRRPPIEYSISGDFLGIFENDDNPYFNFSLKIRCGDLMGDSLADTHIFSDYNGIKFIFDIPDSLGVLKNPIQITNIFPQPTFWSSNEIQYRGKKKLQEVIQNEGLFFAGVNYAKKAESDRKIFLFTILFGAALAFLLDIIVNLIIKWKNLAEKENTSFKRNHLINMEDDLK